MEKTNAELENEYRQLWEISEAGVARLGLKTRPGRKPQWKFTQKTGKLTRDSKKGGIDWYRYLTKIVLPKLIPFWQKCEADRPGMIVQEDNAPSHAHEYIGKVYSLQGVTRMLWPGNSPDLNMIEVCWPWLKRETTRHGAPRTRVEAERAWKKAWKDLPQEKIQMWIERIMRHIQEVIALEGGNEYREGYAEKQRYHSGRKSKTPGPINKMEEYGPGGTAFGRPPSLSDEEEDDREFIDVKQTLSELLGARRPPPRNSPEEDDLEWEEEDSGEED